jgi:hypothetical protein
MGSRGQLLSSWCPMAWLPPEQYGVAGQGGSQGWPALVGSVVGWWLVGAAEGIAGWVER